MTPLFFSPMESTLPLDSSSWIVASWPTLLLHQPPMFSTAFRCLLLVPRMTSFNTLILHSMKLFGETSAVSLVLLLLQLGKIQVHFLENLLKIVSCYFVLAGHSLKSSLRHILCVDRRDSTVFPTKGSFFKVSDSAKGYDEANSSVSAESRICWAWWQCWILQE